MLILSSTSKVGGVCGERGLASGDDKADCLGVRAGLPDKERFGGDAR